jgi:hypothetical protein
MKAMGQALFEAVVALLSTVQAGIPSVPPPQELFLQNTLL